MPRLEAVTPPARAHHFREGPGPWIQGWFLKPTAKPPRLAERSGGCGCAGSDSDRCGRDGDENALAARCEFLDSCKLLHTIFLGSRGRHYYT